MNFWPKSLPDYKWPPRYTSTGMATIRVAMAGIFYIGYLLGRLVSLLGPSRNTVLVIRTDGLGDGLLFEPALESLARNASPRVIHLWAPKLTCELLAGCPSVNRLMSLPRGFKDGNLGYFVSPFWRAKIGFAIGRWTFDRVIYPADSPEPLGNWLFCSVRADEGWITSGDTIHQFDWQQTQTHQRATWVIESRPGHAHESLRNEYLAQQWSNEKSLRKPKLYLPEEAKISAAEQIDAWESTAKKIGGNGIVALVPAASASVNVYPNDKWAVALKKLWDDERLIAVLIGGPGDVDRLDDLAAYLNENELPFLRMEKPLGILEMAAIVGKFETVLSVDTGLAHLAVAQSVSTIVLIGGGNPGRFFPWPNAKHHIALNVSTPCSGCNNRCTETEAVCITQIAPEDIVAAYGELKGRRRGVEVYVAEPRKYQAAG
jgi:ADP-heptose:LPS heptosyltransferase